MGFPRRWNPVEIVVMQRIPKKKALLDPDFGEPAGPTARYGTEGCGSGLLQLCGQVNFGGKQWNGMDPSYAGDRGDSQGWIKLKCEDLDAKSIVMQKGDIIVKIAKRDFDLRITEVRYQNPLRGRFLFCVCEFEQNKKSRGSTQ